MQTTGARRPSLERQTTLYDDGLYGESDEIYHNHAVTQLNYVHMNSQPNKFCQNPSYDVYYDTSSVPFQQEMYGQDEEDRQWDSGGYSYIPPIKAPGSKKLPVIPAQNTNKRRLSLVNNDSFYSVYDERKSLTPTPRRKMPQIPTKRSGSRQSSLDRMDNYRSEVPSHRGASLPPTPTKSSKIVNRNSNIIKNFNSLPPTPGRQLPKPNLNHRSAKTRRNGFMKRTSSAEYAEDDDKYNNYYYTRPGATSASEMYNEDYNYAYQSIEDNLPNHQDINSTQVPFFNDSVTTASVNMEIRTEEKQNHLQYNSYGDTYYNAQEDYNEQDYFDTLPKVTKRQEFFGARSSLLDQNTDSLESRDDELKDSFDTAISSGGTSMMDRSTHSEYATAGDTSFTNTTYYAKSLLDDSEKKTDNQLQYKGDQIISPPKAIPDQSNVAIKSTPQPSITIAQVHNQNTVNNVQSRGFFKQQETIHEEYYDQNEIYDDKDDLNVYLSTQESLEAYVEEESLPNGFEQYNNKAISRESPASVIHIDSYEENQSLRRGSSQITVIDPFHSMGQRPVEDDYVSVSRRGSAVDADNRRISADLYQNSIDETFLPASRKPSVDSYQSVIQRRASVRQHSPSKDIITELPPTIEVTAPGPLTGVIESDDLSEKKTVSFEEEEEKEKRPKITPQQRWLWAYNKILIQLNVSTFSISVIQEGELIFF
ncbi:hypothetical protein HHI36_017154 [Cryptolaemus montrouzieri]|uniref:Uncharacterized protein n=1 Tax=Cryptolaemus montrouzieri TaxID=559131 RepID=A0ABD2NLS1_9CUCU